MSKCKEIVRLYEGGSTHREIAAICRCSLSTVSKTLKAQASRQVGYSDIADMDEQTVRCLLFDPPEKTNLYYQPNFTYIDSQMRLPAVNLSLLWDEYRRECQGGELFAYQYSTFASLYAKWRKEHGINVKVTMHIKHKPGRLLEVDWAGDRSAYIDPRNGEVKEPYVFVACLPYSQRIYVEAFDNMTQQSWSEAHVNAFEYYQGTPELVTPDNLKTGVQKPDYYDPEVNRDYAALASHYNIAILPARQSRPTDKPSTENSVKFAETWILAYLRNERFFSLSELNAAIFRRTEEINAQCFQGLDCSRDHLFYQDELPRLRPLPMARFEPSSWRQSKVGIDYCIQVERQRYSVPYHLVGQHVDVRLTRSVIEIYQNNERICSHQRLYGRFNQYSIKDEHMPEEHRLYADEWNPDRFRSWAASVGPACLKVIDSILLSKPHPALTYRSCMGVMSFARSKGNSFLEDICTKLIATSRKPTYSQVKMLAQANEKTDRGKNTKPPVTESIGDAGLIRGSDYYRLD